MKRFNIIRDARAQAFIVLTVLALLVLLGMIGLGTLLAGRGIPPPVQDEPKKDPVTGLYNVSIVVSGHRDLTIFHRNLHANIHADFVSYYFVNPMDLPSGWSLLDFSKPIHVTVTLRRVGFTPTASNTLDLSVGLGAKWARSLVYSLPSGTYAIEADGIDQDGFTSHAEAQLILP